MGGPLCGSQSKRRFGLNHRRITVTDTTAVRGCLARRARALLEGKIRYLNSMYDDTRSFFLSGFDACAHPHNRVYSCPTELTAITTATKRITLHTRRTFAEQQLRKRRASNV